MKWINVNSVEELKALGKFNTVKKEIKDDLLDKVDISGRGWDELYSNIVQFKFIIENTNKAMQSEREINSYFYSEGHEYIYYLVELNGDIKKNNLGINKNLYTNKKKAKEWKDRISKKIINEATDHPNLNEALEELNNIYQEMIKRT
ncbi:MAG: hypothetical protein ACRC92_08715 [Peptostreptococcaceae bacterium]